MDENKSSSPIRLCIFIAVGILVVAIIFGVVSNISISKKSSSDSTIKNKDEVVLVEEDKNKTDETNSKEEEKKDKESENSSDQTDKSSVSEGGELVETDKEYVPKGSDEGSISIEEITEQNLESEVKSTSVLVSGKGIYKVDDNSYTYSLNLIFPDGDGYKVIKYFCSKKSYDAVENGETITAEYQVDSDGVISIRTVTK